ncbi:WD repeat-containing protein 47 isoform X2 [Drosophila willistoni]|uniref:WD repeat-containing protein 47 isoform X2 n=1 Tax=Drosophila willistoni TaxID=7260 RepID=UPI001F07CFC5|nr:WD repeat-containing protein 47 isoform X2 [Drosophila willistoni]
MDFQNSKHIFQTVDYLPLGDVERPQFEAVTTLCDSQAIRSVDFHPDGKLYAVGSNSKTFRICQYPQISKIRQGAHPPAVLCKRTKHHRGSIYCTCWSSDGELIATGSNDKTIKYMRFNNDTDQLVGHEVELNMHDGTVRDMCFLDDSSTKSRLLVSGGAGNCKIYITDCVTGTPFQAFSGHSGHILSLYSWTNAMFVSGSQDKTIRFWDLRVNVAVNTLDHDCRDSAIKSSSVTAVCVDPTGRLLISGHADSSCMLFDIRGNRPIQRFYPHNAEIRCVRFSPSAYYMLTCSYDNTIKLTDLQGDLAHTLSSVVVAEHKDKAITIRWHPTDFSFVSTSADKTATLWALPSS